jgi:ABC-2 type transport system ATP-binding protein
MIAQAAPAAERARRAALADEVAVRASGLAHAYGSRVALRGVDFEVRRGERFGLLGPNGGGKTTLFRILATLVAPDAGRAEVLGLDATRNARAVRARIGVVFQSPSVDVQLTVVENLRCQGRLHGLSGRDLSSRIAEALERHGLADRARERVAHLSGGLRRRVELAKALLHRPEVLILDEPSIGLDPGARRDFWTRIDELRAERGVTVLLTTHLLDEADRCDRIAVLDRGAVVALGTPNALREAIGGDVVTLRARDAVALCGAIRARFGGAAAVVDGVVRIERTGAHAWAAQIADAFPDEIESVTVARPTLEDVFVRATGHRFRDENGGGR